MLDDQAAQFTGSWVTSNGQPSLIGANYQHDNNTDRGRKTATFTPDIPAAGEYEVRLLYTWHENRSTRTQVTVHGDDGEQTISVNQREPALVNRIPRRLGLFRLAAGTQNRVVISNQDADGYVVVDGIQFVPAAIARDERAGKRDPGFSEIKMLSP